MDSNLLEQFFHIIISLLNLLYSFYEPETSSEALNNPSNWWQTAFCQPLTLCASQRLRCMIQFQDFFPCLYTYAADFLGER